jgi:DNA-directed RNA polymerase specialized sigma24 family protein
VRPVGNRDHRPEIRYPTVYETAPQGGAPHPSDTRTRLITLSRSSPVRVVRQDADVSARHEALERVYRDEADRMWRALLGYSGSAEVASEAVSEAFAQALGRGDDIASPRGWVWSASFKIAKGLLTERNASPYSAEALHDVLPEPVVDLVRALATLPERQRVCVVMHDYGDRPVREVASVLGISTPTVYAHLRQGRRHLRTLLEVEDA